MAKNVIEIRNLSYTYPDGAQALKDLNLDVFEGESVGVIGPNGAGKSTLLLHLNGILRANSQVKILGMEPTEENLPKIRAGVGLVFQDPDDQLFMPTVFEDVAFGPLNMGLPEGRVRGLVKKGLEVVGMEASVDRLAHHLSYGEKKRVAIATVLSMEPAILALDEPSGNLDPISRRNLISLLQSFEDVTKIVATHDLELVLELCERVMVLDRGQMIALGETKELLSDEPLMESHGLTVPLSIL